MRVNAQPICHRDYSWTEMKTRGGGGKRLLKSQYIILSNKFLSWKKHVMFFLLVIIS